MKGGGLMTKADLIDKIASDTGLTKADSSRALESTLGAIKNTLKKNNKVSLVGFGTFSVSKRRKARVGRNPRTGEEIKIKASKSPKFTAGKALKEAVQ
jgi:DNA-binding protein HU-beta